jgi:hypothetical protein
MTVDIAARELPYATTLRAPRAPNLPLSLASAEPAPVAEVTDIAFASVEHSGSAGLVRLGYLQDGRPVALKSYHLGPGRTDAEEVALSETRSAKLLSDLGVGPLFHGVWRDPEGHWNVVFDVARGDFVGTPVTADTFRDLETIFARLNGAGVHDVPDLQMYRDGAGRLMIIDPNMAADGRRGMHEPDEAGGYAAAARLEQLHEAPVDVGRRYLEWLRARKPAAFRGLRALVRRRSDGYAKPVRENYPDLFGIR